MVATLGVLALIAALAYLAKDPVTTVATGAVAVLVVARQPQAFQLIHSHALGAGIFFLLLYLLEPIASGRLPVPQLLRQVVTLPGLVAVLAGLAVSWTGGRGVAVLAQDPAVLPGVLTGTLLAVLLVGGLPAGLIIAAGVVALLRAGP